MPPMRHAPVRSDHGDVADDHAPDPLAAAVAAAQGADRLAPVTVVAPSPYAALFARRRLGATAGPGGLGGVANVACTTADKLLHQLGGPVLAARDLRVAPGPVDLEAVRARAAGSGGWLAELARHPRGLAALHGAVAELRRCPAPAIEAHARRPGRLGELARLVAATRDQLHGTGFADAVDLAEGALAAVASGAGRTLGPVVTVDARTASPVERRLLEQLGATALAPGDGAPRALLGEVRVCADPDEEARAAVRAVLGALDAGVPCWRQAVLHPPGRLYGSLVRQHLAAAGVAVNGPETRRLHHSVAGAALLGLLELPTSDFGRAEVMAWLAAAPVVVDGGGRLAPASAWNALSVRAGVVRGGAQWAARLARLAAEEPERAAEAQDLASFVRGLLDTASAPRGSWAAHATWARSALDRYLGTGHAGWPPEEAAAADQVHGALSALGALDAVSGHPDHGAFARAVRAALEETALDTAELPEGGFGDGVFTAAFGHGRGLRFHTVVTVGLADATVPGAVRDDALLPDDVRRLDVSGGLRTRAARIAALHDDLVAAVGAGGRRRVGTYPRVDPRTGREQVPTRWLASLCAPQTRRRDVASFSAAIDSAPPVSAAELELRDGARWAAQGLDPAASPLARGVARLAAGIGAAGARVGARFTRFDGNVGPGLVSPFDPAAPMSATRLETYARCPRRFLYERVLGITRRTPPEEVWQMEPAPRGTLVHAILEDYLRELLAGGERSLERLQAIATARFAEAEEMGLAGKALLWRMDQAAIRRDLARVFEEEGDLHPLAAELAFGTDEEGAGPAVTVALEDGRRVHFKGKADRVDRAPSGALVVSDYKTGAQRTLADLRTDPLGGGRLLQLPVYALAARTRFGSDLPVRARYWLVSEQRSAPCYSLTLTDDVQAYFRALLGLMAEAVDAGVFPGAPLDRPGDRQFDGCRFCDFDVVCPVNRDRQWARKRGDPALAPLVALADAGVPEAVAGMVTDRFGDDGEPGP